MARREHQEEPEEAEGGMERWLLTYADMITLLLALFVVLFALSTISTKKFTALAQALRDTFSGHTTVVKNDTGLLEHNSLVDHTGQVQGLHQQPSGQNSTSGASGSSSSTSTAVPAGSQSLNQIQAELKTALATAGLGSDASINQTSSPTAPNTSELVVSILSDQVFYTLDSASLGTVGDKVVDTIASVLAANTNNAAVQGYTDDQAIYGGPYASNWELSAERAVHVVERLTSVDNINPDRLAVVGFGQTRPAAPNTSPQNMAENRRVDVVIMAPGESETS